MASVRASLEENVDGARRTMKDLERAGISMKQVTDQLTDEGVKLFAEAFDKLLAAVEKSVKQQLRARCVNELVAINCRTISPTAVKATLDDWKTTTKSATVGGDASLWTNTDEGKWLGWLGIVDEQIANQAIQEDRRGIRAAGYTHAATAGHGRIEPLRRSPEADVRQDRRVSRNVRPGFDRSGAGRRGRKADRSGQDDLHRIEQVRQHARAEYFQAVLLRAREAEVGAAEAGSISSRSPIPARRCRRSPKATDFRHVFFGLPSIGGRYSALSDFGMVPGAIQGLDIAKFLDRAEEMVRACGARCRRIENPGVILGAILGTLRKGGRDKVTIFTSPGISDLGAWLEQLLAESTGKEGKG